MTTDCEKVFPQLKRDRNGTYALVLIDNLCHLRSVQELDYTGRLKRRVAGQRWTAKEFQIHNAEWVA